LENGAERVHSEGLCEYKRIILKWILRNYLTMDFDYSCLGRALNDIIMNFVINRTFRKIVGKVLIRPGVHAPTKSVSVPAAISVVLIFHVSLWPGSTRGRHNKVTRTTTDTSV
jgi:hypothetical protein